MFGEVSANTVGRKQRDQFIDSLMRMASTEDSLDVQAASPIAGQEAAIERRFEAELARPDGLRRIAFAMHPVLKRRLDYYAIGRNNVLLVDEIQTGDVPFYDVDLPEIGAVFTAGRGEPVRVMANVERIQFPTKALSIVHSLGYEELSIRRYQVFDRAKERVAIAVAIGEDDAIIGTTGVVEAAAQVGPNSPIDADSLSRPVIAELGKRIVDKQLPFAAILMNPVQYAELWKWSSNEFDQVTLNRVVETGMVGTYVGARILVSNRVDKNKVYGLTTADKFGRLPERKAVEVKVFDNVPRMRYDILAWEQVGFGVFNTAGVAVANIPSGL